MITQKSKKYFKLIAILIIVSLFSTSLTAFADEGDPVSDRDGTGSGTGDRPGVESLDQGPAQITYTITLPELEFEQDGDGYDLIRLAGYSNSGLPGEPNLPYKTFNYAVPPQAVFKTISLKVVDVQTETLAGPYNIKPAEADMTTSGLEAATVNSPVESEGHSWLKMLPSGQMRKWKIANLAFTPVQFDPESGEITVAKEVTFEINYDLSSDATSNAMLADTVMDHMAKDMIDNYQVAKNWYVTAADQASDIPAGGGMMRLVIITTNDIVAGSSNIIDYYYHEWANRGNDPILITETHYGGLTGQAPNGKSERIRQWLKDNYITWSIGYVLLIGDPDPDDPTLLDSVGDVPMKMVWPGPSGYEESPTDYFYADLSGNWNYDGDTYFGEFTDDYYSPPAGGVDLYPEVFVGRIPVYDDDYATLDLILQKIMDYEMEVNPNWRTTALLPMSYSDVGYDGAPLAEQMMDDYLDGYGYSSWTMYQQGSSSCPANNSIYPSNQELRGDTYVRDRWAANDYGAVTWWGHGSSTEAAVGYGGCWDGDLMTSGYASALDDDHPSFVFLNSCLNGYPENNGNLGYALLENGAIGTVSASRVSWFNPGVGYGDFDGSTTNSGIAYEFDERLLDFEYTAGMALYYAKSGMTPEFNTRLMNYYDFNLYGDPTTRIIDKAPPKVVINEISVGAPDRIELYNYGSTPVNLTSWRFRAYDNGSTPDLTEFTLPYFILPAGGYVILDEASGVNTSTHLYFGENIDWIGDEEGAAILYDHEWVGVDFVRWDADVSIAPYGTGWVGPNPPSPLTNNDPQLGRAHDGVDTNYGSDWCLQNGSMGSNNTSCLGDIPRCDFDGDGAEDPAKFYSSTGVVWWLQSSTSTWESAWLGSDSFDYVRYSDFDGDAVTDPGKFSSTNGTVWYIKSSTDAWEGQFLGVDTYDYVAGNDFDGDGKSDPTKLLPNGAIWYLKSSTGTWEGFWVGPEAFEYVAGSDFDGDGETDPAKYLDGSGVLWYWSSICGCWYGVYLGSDAYTYVSASDFDGDGETDPAKFYASTGTVWWLKSTTETWDAAYMGTGTYTFVGGNDFDDDGITDPAKYVPSTGVLYWLRSSTGTWDSAVMGADAYELVN